jgi:hypothetical protein
MMRKKMLDKRNQTAKYKKKLRNEGCIKNSFSNNNYSLFKDVVPMTILENLSARYFTSTMRKKDVSQYVKF